MNTPLPSGTTPAAVPATPALSPLQRAFLALQDAQAKLAARDAAAREPIAIVGLSCRVPGAVNAEAFWQVMRDGVDAITPVPASRWNHEALFDPDPAVPGRIATRSGGFLAEVDRFDPEFFGIAPREAVGMDPQQRLLLEVAWEALESAGQAPDRLENSATGVYVGVTSGDYATLQLQSGDASLLDAHFASGIAHSIFSGRISYLLGLQGPSLTVDTACSSSLVAVHLACQALRGNECRMALAGGVNLMLAPDLFIALSHARMLAPDGRCKTFDAAADGFARGEGCGVVVLKRLSDAEADGDRVLAVIRGSAVNQDGPSSGLTAPNGPAQEAVIRAALDFAGVSPDQVGFIEAHGTGTELGDPLELRALANVFAPAGAAPRASRLLLGSVKTNVGHLEGAAGVTGLIKLVLALRHRTIPAHLHFETPSPHVPWSALPFAVPREAAAWEPIGGRRLAGVSSFGFSGTNAHVLVEEAPELAAGTAPARPGLLALSARDPAALAELARRYGSALATEPGIALADLCRTANAGRAQFAHRAAIGGNTPEDMHAGLRALAEGASAPNLRTARNARRDPPRIAFLFTGQGAQYSGMARALYAAAPAFRDALDRCAAILDAQLEIPLRDVMFEPRHAALLDQTAYTQPALFALEYALAALWRSVGVTPVAVIGHSVGEYVAACLAGVFSLEDGLRLVAARGRLMQSLPAGGAMAAVMAPEAEVARAVVPHAATVAVAAVNGPAQTVISGEAGAVAAICRALDAAGLRSRALPVSHAFHSPLMDPILDAFAAEADTVQFRAPQLRLLSNITGAVADAAITRPDYWRRHLREAVRFGDGMRALAAAKPDILLEIGPGPTLLGFAGAAFGEAAPLLVPSLRQGRDDWAQLLDAVGTLYLAGAAVDWRGVAAGHGRIIDLPSYPFQRQRHWFRAKPRPVLPAAAGHAHPLLGAELRTPLPATIRAGTIGADLPGFVRAHRVLGEVVLPATAYLEMLLAAARDALRSEAVAVEDVTIGEAMLLAEDGAPRAVQTVLEPGAGGFAVSISSVASADAAEPWTRHVTARLRAGLAAPAAAEPLARLREACAEVIEPEAFYADFAGRGLEFGPEFRTVRQLRRGAGQALGEVVLPAALAAEAGAYRFHPVLLDGCLQVIAAALPRDGGDTLFLPVAIGRYRQHRTAGVRCWSHVSVQPGGGDVLRATLRVLDAEGAVLAELDEIRLKRVDRGVLGRLRERWLEEWLYETAWRPAPVPDAAALVPEQLAGAAAAQLAALGRAAGIAAYEPALRQLEALCVAYTLRAMLRLGWDPKPGETVAAAPLAARLGVAPRHHRLFGRLLAILAESGWLAADGDAWRVARPFADAAPERELARLRQSYPAAAAELELTGRVAAELAEALRGEREPAQLLFPGGSLDTAERLYRDSPTAQFFNGLMAEILAAAARVAGRTLRILEIGAGTGGTTAHVLRRLPADAAVEYTFTDIGPTFVARARERFGADARMRFAVLDLEREPDAQGFAGQDFDIVVASNVIHATADLRRTLGRVRELLQPGGLLAMLEVTAPQRWFDLTVGLTEGWWAFTDTALRPDYPTIDRAAWLQLLPECGFAAAAALPAEGARQGVLALQSVLLARAEATPRHWLVLADAGGVADGLAEKLRARGDACVLVRPGAYTLAGDAAGIDPDRAGDYRALLAELRVQGRAPDGVVHAWSLDAAAWDATDAAALDAARARAAVSPVLLAQALLGERTPPRLWLLTRGAQDGNAPLQAAAWGVTKTLALEHPELRPVAIDLDGEAEPDAVLRELAEPGTESLVAQRGGERRVARLARFRRGADAATAGAPWRLVPSEPGSFAAFTRAPLPRRVPGPDEVQIGVAVSGLNFKDVLNALGLYPGDPGPLGGECAGRVLAVGAGVTHVAPGDAVLAVAGGALASEVVARAELVRRLPDGIGMEEGAAFPIAYLTAEFCLSHLARMRAGDRVLIHAAAGGVGLAAVHLARRAGAEIFATAGSPWKRALLRSLGVAHVFDSRSPDFAQGVLDATGGRGVDVVLNSLSGELIEPSFAALARGGRFVEIGKRGIKSPDWVAALDRGIAYHIVDWGETAERDPALIGNMLDRLVAALGRGELPPLPRHGFAMEDAPRAFRLMAQARHAGRIVLRHAAAETPAVRRDGTYLVTGGLSGLGLVMARFLAERGAARLVLVGRRGVTAEAAPVLEEIRRHGTAVIAEAVDVADAAALDALLQRVRAEGPPLRGVLHGAGVLSEAGVLQQDAEHFARVFAPKISGAWALDRLTRADALDWFVLFSSVAALLGSAGQANHAAANAVLGQFAAERRSRGLPALSLDWGVWSGTGAAAGQDTAERLAAQGFGVISPAQGVAAFERLLGEGAAEIAVLPVDWARYLAQPGRGGAFFAEIAGTVAARQSEAAAPAAAAAPGLRDQLAEAAAAHRPALVAGFVRERVARALGLDAAKPIDPRAPLGELGLDSLLAVELRNTLGTALGERLPATLLFDHPTLEALTDYLAGEVLGLGAAAPEAAPAAKPDLVEAVEDLSDDEIDRMLAQRARKKVSR